MSRKNIDIHVRAQGADKASRDAKKIADALKLLGQDASKASDGAARGGSALGALAADLSKLQGQVGGLKSLSGLVGDLDKAAGAAERLERQMKSQGHGFTALREGAAHAARASADLRTAIDRERQALSTRERALDANKLKLRANTDELRAAVRAQEALNGARRKGVSATGNRPSPGVGLETGSPMSSARASFGAFLAADVAAAEASKRQLETAVAGLNTAIKSGRSDIRAYTTDLKAAEANERRFAQEVMKAGNAVLASNADLHKARTTLSSLENDVLKANKALGTMAMTQEDVARATAKAEDQMRKQARLAEVFNRFANQPLRGGGKIADPTESERLRKQSEAIKVARDEAAMLRAEQGRREQALRSAGGGATAEQVDAFNRMARAAKLAEENVRKLEIQMQRANGASASPGGFAAWSREVDRVAAASLAAANARKAEIRERIAASQTKRAEPTSGFLAWSKGVNTAVVAQSKFQDSAGQASRGAKELGSTVRQTATAMDDLRSRTNGAVGVMGRLRGEFLTLTASAIGFHAAMRQGVNAIAAFRTMESMESRLGAVFNQDSSKVAKEIAWLRSEAHRLGIEFGVLGNQYAKFAVAANASNFSEGGTREIFKAVAEAGRVNKLSTEQVEGTFLAIEQIISKGKFTSEEVRRQLGDRLPGAFAILAKSMGLTTAELDKMMANGELLATESNLLKFAEELTRRFGPQLSSSLDTVTTDIGRFQNEIFNTRITIAKGMIEPLRKGLQSFVEFSRSADGAKIFRQIGEFAGGALRVLAEIPKYFNWMTVAAKMFVAVKVAQNVSAIATAFRVASASWDTWSTGIMSAAASGQQLGRVTHFLSVSVHGLNVRLGASIAAQQALIASTARSTIGMRVWLATLMTARVGLTALANAARVAWAAIGGPIGLLAGAATAAYMLWPSKIGAANDALHQHERILDNIRQAYAGVSDKTSDWVKKIEGASVIEVTTAFTDLQKSLPTHFDKLAKLSEEFWNKQKGDAYKYFLLGTPLSESGPKGTPFTDDELAAVTVFRKWEQGAISAGELRKALDSLFLKTDEDRVQKYIIAINESLKKVEANERGLSLLGRALQMMGVDIVKTTGYTGALADEQELLNEALNDGAAAGRAAQQGLEEYGKAIDALKAKIPGLSAELERAKALAEIDASSITAFSKAGGDPEKLQQLWELRDQALDAANVSYYGNAGLAASAALIKKKEGLRLKAYWDQNHYRVGYGSDTYEGANGQERKTTEHTTITEADAERNLLRRLVRYEAQLKKQIGGDRYDSLAPQQQAALMSIIYNYGSLTNEKIGKQNLDALKQGSVDEVVAAIRRMGEHNDGMNRTRRYEEAALFASGGTTQATQWLLEDHAAEEQKKIDDKRKATREEIADLDRQITQQRLINQGKDREAAITDAIHNARKANEFITNAEIADIRERVGALWDEQNVKKEIELSEERLNRLQALRQETLAQAKIAQDEGNFTQAEALREQAKGMNDEITQAIEQVVALWQAFGGPESEVAIAKLRTMRMQLDANSERMGWLGLKAKEWQSAFDSAIDGVMNGFNAMKQAIIDGDNAFKAFGLSVLQTLAQVMQQIAMTIIKMQILQALSKVPGPVGQFAQASLAAMGGGGMTGHTGGIVGSKAIGGGNEIRSSGWVANAFHGVYHTGGIAGLRPDEVSATLKKGEEILTQDDPRHRFNAGGEQAASEGTRLTQILAIGEDQVREMMGRYGDKATLTHIKANAPTIRRMLGV